MVTRSPLVLAATLIFPALCLAQIPAEPQLPPAPGPDSTVLQTGVNLVVLDVVVQDSDGNPVHGLKASNFQLFEEKKPQQIRNSEEHLPPAAITTNADLGKMPPGTFTNYTPVPPGSALNILLLDALNTPVLYQKWVREQLRKYVDTAPPGQRIAIFGLTNDLILLQGFTSDPAILKDVIDHKITARASTHLDDPIGTGSTTDMDAYINFQGSLLATNANMFNVEVTAADIARRIDITLDAFNALAHYLSGFPGRKNLIWFSGSFPTGVIGNPTSGSSADASSKGNAIKQTTAALATAQVSIYPIDARGLMTDPSYNTANSNSNSAALTTTNPSAAIAAIHNFSDSQASEHSTMDNVAADTGGRAFYNTNGIKEAVQEAIQTGANYYTLSYNPTDHNWNSNFRSIQLKLIDAPPGLKLSYRSGYYAFPPRQLEKIDPSAISSTSSFTSHLDRAYDRAAMTRGAPLPEDILFKVRVLPFATPPETKLAPDNAIDPNSPVAGPFNRYAVDYALQPSEITLIAEPNGNHAGQIKFTVYVYDANGKLLVAAHRGFNLTLKPDLYAKFIKAALQCHMEVSVPDKTDAFLRIAVQDMPSDKFGVVEIPAAAVSRLSPLPSAHTAPAH